MRKDKVKKKIAEHRGIIIEFKDFALRGNVMDMAIAAVIALAFGQIINALVNKMIFPVITSFIHIDYSNLSFKINGIPIPYGELINAVVNFFFVALIMFIAVKFINIFAGKKNEEQDEQDE